ncbi:MAG TPA: helix-turn-helix transcriptional regulator, partial [Phycisphaeraceae bacterium]
MQSVGELVRTRRQARGMTLAALARAAGVTKSYLSMIENQRVANPPSRQVLAALEEALGMEEGELRCVAAWQSAPLPVRAQLEHLAEQARRAQEFARWLRASTSRRAGGGKNLDKLYRTGQLRKRLQEMIGEAEEAERDDPPVMPLMPAVRSRVPLINKVAAGYPSGFT